MSSISNQGTHNRSLIERQEGKKLGITVGWFYKLVQRINVSQSGAESSEVNPIPEHLKQQEEKGKGEQKQEKPKFQAQRVEVEAEQAEAKKVRI